MFRKLFFVVFVFGIFSLNSFAQCDGVYFRTYSSKPFSVPIRFLLEDLSRFKDVTGDGKMDFIGLGAEISSAQTAKIHIVANDGSGGLGAASEITLPGTIQNSADHRLLVADFNSDGKNDLFVRLNTSPTNTAAGELLIYRNNGTGTFTPLTSFALPSNEFIQNVVDVNNDNIADLITAVATSPALSSYYRLGNADGTFGAAVFLGSGSYSISGDFNNDGKVDFAVSPDVNPPFTFRINYNQGGGNFSLSNPILTASNPMFFSAVKDLNNDGKLDLIGNVGFQPQFFVFLNGGNGSFSRADYANPEQVDRTSVGDFNGDGFADVIVYSSGTLPKYFVFTNDGSGNLTQRDYTTKLSGAVIGDVDGDGKADLLRINNYNPNNTFQNVRIFNETRLSVSKNVCSKQGQTRLVDFNRDQKTDRTFLNAGLWRYNVNPESSTILSFNWGISGDIAARGDYDTDGITDFAIYRPSEGNWYIRNSSDGSYSIFRFGLNGDKPVPADYNGDGRTDAAVYRPSEGNWYVLYSGSGQYSIQHFGIAEDKPVQEDYDGDGKTDLAVFRPSTGVWYYLKSSDGNFAAIQWGLSTDNPAPGDFDGDGRADLTVYRQSEGVWYILRSSNSGFVGYRFGTAGDIPQVGDWDGDGIMDLGVYRPSSSNWYSSDNVGRQVFNGNNPISSILNID